MENQPTLSDNYRSGFMVRIKKTNGKVNSVWLEISSHNAVLGTTLSELNKLVKDMKLEEQIPMSNTETPKEQPQPEHLNVRYDCGVCHYSFPCFPSSPKMMSYYCPACGKWRTFTKS
jgi:hypothetical protein